MGTNYYVHQAIPVKKREHIKSLVNMRDLYSGALYEAIKEFQPVHIGKSSCGWKFLFNHNDCKFYDKTQTSIDAFLRKSVSEGGQFVDEYGDEQDIDKFWDMVRRKQDGFDLKSYYDYECQRWKEYQKNPDAFKDEFFKPHRPDSYTLIDHVESFSDDAWHLRFSDAVEFC